MTKSRSLDFLSEKKGLIILAIIIAVGSYLRLFGVFTNSFAFTYDVGRDMLALSSIVSTHKIPLIGATTGLPGVFYGPWWYILLTPFFIIFGGDPAGIALVMAIVGIASIALAYIAGKKISSEFAGLCFAAIVSVSPALISLSAQIWNPNIAPLFVLITLLLLVNIFSNEKKVFKSYFLLGIVLALCIDIEIIFGTLFLIGIALSVLVIKKVRIPLKNVLFFFFGALVIFSPRILFEIRHGFLMTHAFFKYFGAGKMAGQNILDLIISRFNILLDQFSSTVGSGNKIAGLLIFILICLQLVLRLKKAGQTEKNFIYTSILILLVFFLGTIFFSHDIWPHYLVGLPIIYCLVLAVSIRLLAHKFGNLMGYAAIFVIFILNFNPVAFVSNLKKPLWEGDASVYRNQVAVVDYVYREAGNRQFKYVVYTPPLYDYTYQYLFNWYGPKKYHKSPQSQSKLAFFILEPDYENPYRLISWVVSRAGDGHIIKSKVVKGGIIVQTRTN